MFIKYMAVRNQDQNKKAIKPPATTRKQPQEPHILRMSIDGIENDMNIWIKACNRHFSIGNNMKKRDMYIAMKQMMGLKMQFLPPYFIEFHYFCKNRKKDKDNIAGYAHKIILDALQKMKIIPNDNWANIEGFSDHFYIDAKNPRIDIIIRKP